VSALVSPERIDSGPRAALRVRRATYADNAALVALTLACPMEGDIGLVSDRTPDFFALNRLEGERWQVLVAEDAAERVVGCVALAARRAWLAGREVDSLYVSDLKVHPEWRGGPAADLLEQEVRDAAERMGGPDVPVLLTVLAGNRAMERRTPGPRGLPRLDRFATFDAWSIPLAWRRPAPEDVTPYTVEAARPRDLEAMAELWACVAPTRQWTPAHDAASLARFIARAPGLDMESVRLAFGPDGRLAAWAAVWDQSVFKRMRVTRWSPRLKVARAVVNAVAPWLGAQRLPDVGAPLPGASLALACVPVTAPSAMRALVLDACRLLHGRAAFLSVGLDERDPLRAALRGLMAQPTRVHAYATTPAAPWSGAPLDDRPFHCEIALV
jgi:N-acetylglutamate synthase-like GNAT family acetyltransferase